MLISSHWVLLRRLLGLLGYAILGVCYLASKVGELAGQLNVASAVSGGLLGELAKSLLQIRGHLSSLVRPPHLVLILRDTHSCIRPNDAGRWTFCQSHGSAQEPVQQRRRRVIHERQQAIE